MFKWIYELTDKLRQKLSEKGQGMVEYALILAAVALIAVAVLWNQGGLKDSVAGAFGSAKTNIDSAVNNNGTGNDLSITKTETETEGKT